MTYEEKVEQLSEFNEEAVIFHEIEDSLVGIGHRIGMDPIAVYDYEKAILCIMGDDDSEDAYESAVEYFEYNTLGTWAGEGTPMFIMFFDDKEECKQCHCKAKAGSWLKRIGTRITETLERCGRWLRRGGN